MFRYLFILLICVNFLLSNDDIVNKENNIVKTSELELFLFKIGFQSLLKDVDITKNKSTINENDIRSLNEKIELILSELYKNDRVLLNDSIQEQSFTSNDINSKELEILKKEIKELKLNIKVLKDDIKKDIKDIKKEKNKTKEVKLSENKVTKMRTAASLVGVYQYATTNSKTIRNIKRNTIISIDYCKNGWCKLKNEDYFVRKFLLAKHE